MSFWIITLIVITTALFILPLVPGLVEIVRKTDVKPLRVSQAYDSNPFHFAEGFREYIRKQFPDIHSAQNHNGRLSDGTQYQMVGEKGIPNLDASSVTAKLLLSAHPLTLPAGELFEMEIYGAQSILTGERSHFRALLSDDKLQLRESCTILRWAHSNGEMAVGRHSKLFGRATSNQSIVLGDDVQFERLHAPRVLTASLSTTGQLAPKVVLTALRELDDVKIQYGRRWVLNDKLDFPANHSFDGDIITGTTAIIGDNAHISGSIKCNADNDVAHHLQNTGIAIRTDKKTARCEVGNWVRIDGSLISSNDLYIGQYCQIMGPVIAEGVLVIGAGTVIGSPECPTTVTAPRIIIESGCTVYGTLWATENGIVRTASQDKAVA